jgi:predicted RNA-binding Zn-ribbon protein involved in translation (DUF1610 family)
MGNLKTIVVFDDLSIAYIARSKLEAFGIPCFLTNEYFVGIHFLYVGAVQGVELKVPESRADDARELLADSRPTAVQATDGSRPTSFEQALLEPDYVCPRCGSADVKRFSLRRPLVALSWLLHIPLRWNKSFYKCEACGHKWRDGHERPDGRGSRICCRKSILISG